MSSSRRYTSVQIVLHWATLILIAINWLTGEAMKSAFEAVVEQEGGGGITLQSDLHVWLGVAIIGITILRLGVRAAVGVPPADHDGGALDRLAGLAHWGLYLLLVLVPVFGGLAWFAGMADFGDIHVYTMNTLLALIGLHAAAALYHQFILRDNLISRMR